MIPQTSPGAEAPVDYPYPGSAALLADGNLWRVERLNADGTITLSRPGHPGASGRRTCAPDELIDPGSRIARREDAPLAVRLASALKELDAVHFVVAIDKAQIITAEHRLSIRVTPSRVAAILADLGWRRAAGKGPIVYLRGETTVRDVAAPKRRRAA